jgi:LysR family transcriptional regulator of gallate degradation
MSHDAPFGPHDPALLRRLRDFAAVARAGSIAGAAGLLYKAPSAIARAVTGLEAALGVALFERRPRGMLLNAYGEAALARAGRIDEEIAAAAGELAHLGRLQALHPRVLAGTLGHDRSLALLVALAGLRNLSAAASQLGLTQAGASMALARLEAALGIALFQRMMQGMLPTDAGALLVLRARRILAELRHMQADIAALGGTWRGEVTIGALPLARTTILPAAIAAALRRHPALHIFTVESPYRDLVAGLRSGEVDFIIGALREGERNSGLACERLFADEMRVIVRAGHPLARRRRLTLEKLLGERWIFPRPGTPGRRLVDLCFADLGRAAPRPPVETGDLAILRGLLQSSDMLTALSPRQLAHEIAAGDLVTLPVALPRTSRWIGITTRHGARLPPAATVLLEEIRRAARG